MQKIEANSAKTTRGPENYQKRSKLHQNQFFNEFSLLKSCLIHSLKSRFEEFVKSAISHSLLTMAPRCMRPVCILFLIFAIFQCFSYFFIFLTFLGGKKTKQHGKRNPCGQHVVFAAPHFQTHTPTATMQCLTWVLEWRIVTVHHIIFAP